jgi:hypothetical protein
LFRGGNQCRDLVRVVEQARSLGRQSNAIGGAIEKASPEIFFERLDLKRNGGLSKEKVFRSFAKIQMLGHGAKHFETKVFQLGHAMIIHGNG